MSKSPIIVPVTSEIEASFKDFIRKYLASRSGFWTRKLSWHREHLRGEFQGPEFTIQVGRKDSHIEAHIQVKGLVKLFEKSIRNDVGAALTQSFAHKR